MLVEFIGCSGAGKTTLVKDTVQALLAQGQQAVSSKDLIAQLTKTSWIRNETWRNAVLNVLLLPSFFKARQMHRKIWQLAYCHIVKNSASRWDRFNRLRSFMRLMAEHQLLVLHHSARGFVLVDEGVLGGVQNPFVHVQAITDDGDVVKYAQIVPLAHLIVHVDAPLDSAVERTLGRQDPPYRSASRSSYQSFIANGRKVFDVISGSDRCTGRLLKVMNSDDSQRALRIHSLVQFILKQQQAPAR